MAKLRALLVGATGIAGQQFVSALRDHPWFEIGAIAASPRNAGKRYDEAVAGGWFLSEPIPADIAALRLLDPGAAPRGVDLVFSAVESDVARELEPRFAAELPVISAASTFRMEPDVPLLIPPVNAGHVGLVAAQRARGWRGSVVPIPNCTTTGLAVVLAPLAERFGVRSVVMTSLQAVSGAGRSPGVAALDILDNVIPYIPKEEGKVEAETRKILGRWVPGTSAVEPMAIRISATCTRVAVQDGHTETVSVGLGRPASPDEVKDAFRTWEGSPEARDLPSSAPRWIEVLEAQDRPQPRLDRETHGGMATSVGRIREEPVLEHGVKLVLVSHNTKMGAARGAVLVAELMRARGFLGR
ncbi:MAG: aspartate-semialdehyde dehydrogenase [Myxococcaceae bacterium]